MKKSPVETIARLVFLLCALSSIAALLVIALYILRGGVPAIAEIGVGEFLLGMKWQPKNNIYGILPMIVSSVIASACAFVLASVIGKWAAVCLACFCPPKLHRFLKSAVELMAGIPSVIYGFFGAMVIVPIIRENLGGPGKSMLAAIAILTIMVLPTVVNLSEAALRQVPKTYYEGALALGAMPTEAVLRTVVPAASSGIRTSYILGLGRALGETMAVILVAGNSVQMFSGFLNPTRTLTTGIALEMGYASGLHQGALLGIGVVLFILIFALNLTIGIVAKRGKQ